MSMFMSVWAIATIVLLAVIILRNPNQENKNLIAVLLLMQLILVILDMFWK